MYNHEVRYLSFAYVLQERFITQKLETDMMCYNKALKIGLCPSRNPITNEQWLITNRRKPFF